MWPSSDDCTVLAVDPLPLRSLGLVGIVNRLFQGLKGRAVLVMPDDLDEWIQANHRCSVIIYNVGEGSVADHRHFESDQDAANADDRRTAGDLLIQQQPQGGTVRHEGRRPGICVRRGRH